MLTRTRSKTLFSSPPADSTSEDDLFSSQSQSNSDVLTVSSVDSNSALLDDDTAAPLADLITLAAASATIHIHCPTTVSDTWAVSAAIDLTADESLRDATVGWSDVAARSEVHVLPCAIHYNGPAAVQQYFQPTQANCPTSQPHPATSPTTTTTTSTTATTYISTSAAPTAHSQSALLAESRWYTAAFRGRLLTGERVTLPQHTIGVVLRDAPPTGTVSGGGSGGSKRHRGAAADGRRVDGAEDGGSAREAGSHVDWLVDGWFDSLTLWGRDSDWAGADQSWMKRSLLDWPVIAAALHSTDNDVPLVER